jgi:hypothetical protein
VRGSSPLSITVACLRANSRWQAREGFEEGSNAPCASGGKRSQLSAIIGIFEGFGVRGNPKTGGSLRGEQTEMALKTLNGSKRRQQRRESFSENGHRELVIENLSIVIGPLGPVSGLKRGGGGGQRGLSFIK